MAQGVVNTFCRPGSNARGFADVERGNKAES